jgi:K+-sensing histidine kinase KdpD
VVDRQLEGYLRSQGTESTWGVQERILVCVTAHTDATEMLESGRRNADRFQGEFHVLCIGDRSIGKESSQRLERNIRYARDLRAAVHLYTGTDAVSAILEFATQHGITQIFVGRGGAPRDVWTKVRGNLAVRLIRAAEGIDVVVYPQR